MEKPSDASATFEHLSASVKEARAAPAVPARSKGQEVANATHLKWTKANHSLFSVPDEPKDGGPVVPDIFDEANLWECAGVSFGRLETYRLYLAVKKVRRCAS